MSLLGLLGIVILGPIIFLTPGFVFMDSSGDWSGLREAFVASVVIWLVIGLIGLFTWWAQGVEVF